MRSRGAAKAACVLGTSALLMYAMFYFTMFLKNPTPDLLPRLERAAEHTILDKLEGIERQIDQIGEFFCAHTISFALSLLSACIIMYCYVWVLPGVGYLCQVCRIILTRTCIRVQYN